jgi:hypothetical protein
MYVSPRTGSHENAVGRMGKALHVLTVHTVRRRRCADGRMQAALGQGFGPVRWGWAQKTILQAGHLTPSPETSKVQTCRPKGQTHDRFESVDRQDIRKSPHPRRGRHRCCGCGVVKRLGPEDCPIVLGQGQRQLWELPDGFLQNIPWAPGP